MRSYDLFLYLGTQKSFFWFENPTYNLCYQKALIAQFKPMNSPKNVFNSEI